MSETTPIPTSTVSGTPNDNSPTGKSALYRVEKAIERATHALIHYQHSDGYWCFELEADCTIPAEYIMMMHYLDEIDDALESKISVYLRRRQTADGSWPLYRSGKGDLSCTVKVYYALKLAGDGPDAPHMAEARGWILSHGGAARTNVFTRIALALFRQVPWRATPCIPVECMFLPRWFPFHLSKVSYWSRTVMVPLLILCSFKARAKNPKKVNIRELFLTHPEKERHYHPVRSPLNRVFLAFDACARRLERLIPTPIRRRAARKAENWIVERLNGEGGLGAIFPAMVNALEALHCLGYPPNNPNCITLRKALLKLLVIREDEAYCQPCVSPIWDTSLVCLAFEDVSSEAARSATRRALQWLQPRQLLNAPGDWRDDRPQLLGGGWPFQFYNDPYPDLDDTAVVAYAMVECKDPSYDTSVERAAEWLCGMQSKNGGFAAFDVNSDHYYLNEIPFADHGALLDPPTSDVTARCLMFLCRLEDGAGRYAEVLRRSLEFLTSEQEEDGSWFGRWGSNYIYGTWSVLIALEQAGTASSDVRVRRAVDWLRSVQRADGGWGESNDSYTDDRMRGRNARSTSFQTAWALLALMAAGEAESSEVARGIEFLLQKQKDDGLWMDLDFTAPGFPRVFYLKYHGYDKLFPLWSLARYARSVSRSDTAP